MTKKEQAIELSEELLSDIELNTTLLEQIVIKNKRLARLVDDHDCIKRMDCEINGYVESDLKEYYNFIKRSGRILIDNSDISKYQLTLRSISGLESALNTNNIKLSQYSLPANADNIIIHNLSEQRVTIEENIRTAKERLSKIKNSIYNYILSVNYKLKYSEIAEGIFNSKQNIVLNKLGIDPKYNDIINSISSNLQSSSSNDWSNAGHNCRRLLKQFADNIYPVDINKLQIEIGEGKNKKITKLGDENYINRIMCYIDSKTNSDKFIQISGSHLSYIGDRLDSLYGASSKGTHADISKSEAERYVIYTYLLISDILEL